jgi:hypothetical protein
VQPPEPSESRPAVREPHLAKCRPDTPPRSPGAPSRILAFRELLARALGEPTQPDLNDGQTDTRQTGATTVTAPIPRGWTAV